MNWMDGYDDDDSHVHHVVEESNRVIYQPDQGQSLPFYYPKAGSIIPMSRWRERHLIMLWWW